MRAPVLLSANPAPFMVGADALRAGSTGGVGGGVVVLVLVGLLLGLLLITAGCGPPN